MRNSNNLFDQNPDKLMIIKTEGDVQFYIYKEDEKIVPSKAMNVFYNEKMVINRDLSALAVFAYDKLFNKDKLRIVDCMSASGIGALRILKECENIDKIVINDINPLAVALIKDNLKLNELESQKIIVTQKDANQLLLELASDNPNVINIDPFGTPNLYVDAAFKAIQKKSGLVCITATDTAVLFGIRPHVCIRKYMSKPLHVEYTKEIGARILLYFISRVANINKLGIIPLLTFYSNHFIRIFALTFKSKEKITNSFSNYGYIIHCRECGFRTRQSINPIETLDTCPSCENKKSLSYAGPLWVGIIHDSPFLRQIITENNVKNYKCKKKIDKLINFALQENTMPLSYYNLHKLCRDLKCSSVPKIEQVIQTIKEFEYEATRTHFDPLSIKTDLNIENLKKIILKIT
ncbi:MAG: tRNA (guanine(10)-N(2))-dimethyltransferase [Candidatus Lokiarchaeota archaeon]|nr:tRNA (guanine(10)-N(2))-dimethyltransferase [Candidatus Lokiarchaeota archaeon]